MLALLGAAALLFGPALLRDRTPVASTAAPPPLVDPALIEVPPGDELCANDIVLTPRSELAQVFLAQPDDRPAPPLEIRASGDGYASPAARVEGGTPGGDVAMAAIEPPDHELFGRLCITNAGDVPATLVGTNEFRTQTRMQTTVGGEPVTPDLSLTFYEDRQVTLVGFVPELVDAMTVFRGFLGWSGFVWALLVLVVAGVPAGVLYALFRSAVAERERG